MEMMHYMDYECKNPNADALREYQDFMYNPDNEYHCHECPERGANTRDYGFPCGQQVCWVTCHCREGVARTMGENNYYPFHIRLELAKMFEAWADEHGVSKCPESVITYICMKGLLSYKEIKAFLNNSEKDGE